MQTIEWVSHLLRTDFAKIVSLGGFLTSNIFNIYLYDRLVQIQFRDARSQWEADGCPSGFFWHPEGLGLMKGGNISRVRQILSMMTRTPEWIDGLTMPRQMLRMFRCSSFSMYLFIALSVVCWW